MSFFLLISLEGRSSTSSSGLKRLSCLSVGSSYLAGFYVTHAPMLNFIQ